MNDNVVEAKRDGLARLTRGTIGWIGCLGLVALIALELFAWLLPQRLEDESHWYARAAMLSLYVRVFQLHLGLGTMGLTALFLLTRWWRTALFSGFLAITLLVPYARDFAPKNSPPLASKSFRLMSINLYAYNFDEAAIVRSIDVADPDVLILIEVTEWCRQNVINKHLLSRYTYVNQPRAEGQGVVLTRLPFRIGETPPTERRISDRRPVLINLDGKEIALYAVHLVSPGRPALVEHNRIQVAALSSIVGAETHPTIIAGDCNFSQLSPNAAAFHRAGLRSTHELIGFGFGNTWGPKWRPWLNRLPGVRIDHIWLSPGLTATSHAVGLDTGSDHRPVIADIGLTSIR